MTHSLSTYRMLGLCDDGALPGEETNGRATGLGETEESPVHRTAEVAPRLGQVAQNTTESRVTNEESEKGAAPQILC